MGHFPDRARIVIVGGGVGGASVAFHLARRGETDVLLVERAELTSGSTFHSAGLVGQLRSDPALTRMNVHSVELYRELSKGEHDPGWVESGSLRLASSADRLTEIRRQHGWAQRAGLPLELVSADEARELFPLMSTDGVRAAAHTPTDGQIDPARLCYALAAGARAAGVRIAQRTRVVGIDTVAGPHGRKVTGVRLAGPGPQEGDLPPTRGGAGDGGGVLVECEAVVDCGGMFAAEIAALADVRIPVVPMSHQYVVTAPLPAGTLPARPLPSLRDPDLLVYYRQELDGLVMGGYERHSAPAWASHVPPADFNGKLLPFDLDRFTEILENAQVRVPMLADVGVTSMINGPEAFTPDNEFCLGETEVAGLFVAAGFCAHGIAGAGGIGDVMANWVLDGDPGLDLWHMDIRRFGRHYRSPSYTFARTRENYESYYDIGFPGTERAAGRPLRTSPAYPWHAAHGAVFGEKAGWERVNHYGTPGDEGLRPGGWAGRHWSPCVEPEHRAVRESAGLFDETSFAEIEISGPDAAGFCAHVFAGHVGPSQNGAVVYTQALNERGGIEMDVTVTRLAEDAFLVVTGTASGEHDLGFLRHRARQTGAGVRLVDVTSAWACFGLWGPRSRALLAPLTPASLENPDFPYLSMRATTVADVPVRALRVTYVGELGWELHCPTEYGAALWSALAATGATPGGYRAIESLRLEKGYRAWGSDIGPDTTPAEAGLGFAVRRGGGFVGAEAASRPPARRLRGLVIAEPRAVALGGEPVRVGGPGVGGPGGGGPVVGQVTSGGYGYTVASSIAYAYLPVDAPGPVEVAVDGEWHAAEVTTGPLYDPKNERPRA